MEILTIVLASLLSLGSSGGIVLDKIAEAKIRDRIISVEQQAVRIDNQPNYRIAQGKIGRVRLAHRGILIEPGIRIAALDLETDPLAVKLSQLKLDSIASLRSSLVTPATGAASIKLEEEDLNRALSSTQVRQQLEFNLNRLIVRKAGSSNIAYELSNVRLDIQPNNRLRVSFRLARSRATGLKPLERSDRGTSQVQNRSRELAFNLELTLKIVEGKAVRILNPRGTVNGSPMSSRLLDGFATGISDRLNLASLAGDGIIARILQLETSEDAMQLVGFVRLETEMP